MRGFIPFYAGLIPTILVQRRPKAENCINRRRFAMEPERDIIEKWHNIIITIVVVVVVVEENKKRGERRKKVQLCLHCNDGNK